MSLFTLLFFLALENETALPVGEDTTARPARAVSAVRDASAVPKPLAHELFREMLTRNCSAACTILRVTNNYSFFIFLFSLRYTQ